MYVGECAVPACWNLPVAFLSAIGRWLCGGVRRRARACRSTRRSTRSPECNGLHRGIGDHRGGVAVPGAGPVGAAVADAVDPFLEFDVVGGDEPFPPVLGHPAGELVVLPDGDRAGFAERGGAVLADDLAADVVAVADVDRDLDIDQGAAAPSPAAAPAGPAVRRRSCSSAGTAPWSRRSPRRTSSAPCRSRAPRCR